MPEGMIDEVPASPAEAPKQPTQPELIAAVPGGAEAPAAAPVAEQPVITGVPAEIGGDAVRATVEANQAADAAATAERDQKESFLGASTVTSKLPPQMQQPPTPEA